MVYGVVKNVLPLGAVSFHVLDCGIHYFEIGKGVLLQVLVICCSDGLHEYLFNLYLYIFCLWFLYFLFLRLLLFFTLDEKLFPH